MPHEMGRCKNCRWWIAFEYDGASFFNECDNAKMKARAYKTCDDYAVAVYDDEYVYVKTGPEFGCVHWEAK